MLCVVLISLEIIMDLLLQIINHLQEKGYLIQDQQFDHFDYLLNEMILYFFELFQLDLDYDMAFNDLHQKSAFEISLELKLAYLVILQACFFKMNFDLDLVYYLLQHSVYQVHLKLNQKQLLLITHYFRLKHLKYLQFEKLVRLKR